MRYDPFWHRPLSRMSEDARQIMRVLIVFVAFLLAIAGAAAAKVATLGAVGFILLAGFLFFILLVGILFAPVAVRLQIRSVERWWRARLASKKVADELVSQLCDSPALARDVYEKLGDALAKGLPPKRPQ